MVDIKAKIEEVVEKVKRDEGFQKQFKENPVKAVESLLGVDLPDETISKIVEGVKAKVNLDSAKDLVGKIKGLF